MVSEIISITSLTTSPQAIITCNSGESVDIDFLSLYTKINTEPISGPSIAFASYPPFTGVPSGGNSPLGTTNKLILYYRKTLSGVWVEFGQIPLFNLSQSEWNLFDLLAYFKGSGFLKIGEGAIGCALKSPLAFGSEIKIFGGVTKQANNPELFVNNFGFNTIDSSRVILASNAQRVKISIYNEGNNDVYLNYGGTASTSSYVAKISPGFFLVDDYLGIFSGICNVGETSSLRVTEFYENS